MKSLFQRLASEITVPRSVLLVLLLATAWGFPTLRDKLMLEEAVPPKTHSPSPATPPSQVSGPEKFTFISMGGVQISARLHRAQSNQAPLILLVHGLRGGMERWDPALEHWTGDSEFTWAQVELRKTASPPPGNAASTSLGNENWAGPLADVRGLLATLRAEFNIAPSRIGILGEDLGGSLALLLAAEDPSISALAVLHPGLEYRKWNIRPAASSLGQRPALYIATADDGYARHSAKALAQLSPLGEARIVHSVSAHGAALLKENPLTAAELLQWFHRTLKTTPERQRGPTESPPSAVTADPSTP